MSPEQARNEPVDHRSDLYSLAVCLHEALTGERLFVGDLSTPPDVIYGQPILPPSKKRLGLPRALDDVLATALAPKPDDRYQDATAFAEALRQVAHRFGLMYSTPQLADHLRDILGPDPTRWLHEETAGPSEDRTAGTQKIPTKAHEGKEVASIGVVEGSNLYVVSGGDVVSPKQPVMSTSRPPSGPKPPTSARDPFIPIHEDDDDAPTVARNIRPGPAAVAPAAQPKRPGPTSPYTTLSSPGGPSPPVLKRPMTVPPPPPAAAFAPPAAPSFAAPSPAVPVFAPGGSSFTAPPPPPMPPSRAFGADAPFDPDMPTPAPPPTDEFMPPTPPPTQPLPPIYSGPPQGASLPGGAPAPRRSSPALPVPTNGWGQAAQTQVPAPAPAPHWAPAPFELQQPDTIDFAADAQPLVVRRSGPPGLLVLVVLLGAMAGGAKLAHVVTRGDMAALDAPPTAVGAPAPAK
jgi:hypothetical protein